MYDTGGIDGIHANNHVPTTSETSETRENPRNRRHLSTKPENPESPRNRRHLTQELPNQLGSRKRNAGDIGERSGGWRWVECESVFVLVAGARYKFRLDKLDDTTYKRPMPEIDYNRIQ